MDIIDAYRTFYPKAAEYTFCSGTHGTFTKWDHALGHSIHLSKFKKIQIRQGVFPGYNGIKLEINNNRFLENSQISGN